MHEKGLTCVAVYKRTLPTSVERVWENVRDWEHLPWLHSRSFSSIECQDEGDWGWRARIGLPDGKTEILFELVIEPGEPRYVSRTLEGGGAGTEIWTQLEERGKNESHVVVEFWLPDVAPERADSLGDLYVELYTRLWDEDESMMLRRAGELSARRSLAKRSGSGTSKRSLGLLPELRKELPRVVRMRGESFRIVEVDGTLLAHAVVCPHRLGPLAEAEMENGRITCPWHGYTFDVTTGRECTGRRMRLAPAPRVEVDPDQRVWLL